LVASLLPLTNCKNIRHIPRSWQNRQFSLLAIKAVFFQTVVLESRSKAQWHIGCSDGRRQSVQVISVGESFKILVTDRNRRVRELLRRELAAEGYQVVVARDSREVLMMIAGDEPPHLLLLDPEIPNFSEPQILEQLQKLCPGLPVIIHTFLLDDFNHWKVLNSVVLLEKKEDIDLLKQVVAEVIDRNYPPRLVLGRDT
jgi:CheY-like chemotaxis protein